MFEEIGFEEETYQIPKQGRIGKVGVLIIPTNPNCLEISTRRVIAEEYANREKSGYSFGSVCKPELFEILWSIEGIESILLRQRYSILVCKAVSFSWEELLPQICSMIEQWQES